MVHGRLARGYVAGMQRGIVAFEIPRSLEGKREKLTGEDRDAVDQARTREALAAADDAAGAGGGGADGAPPR